MSLIARAASTLSFSVSGSLRKGKPWKSEHLECESWEREDRTGRPVINCHKQFIESSYSARYSRWDDDKAWSSQEWKADELMDDRTEQPVVTFGAKTHESQSSFSHEKTHHVILEEEKTHDRTGTPVVCLFRGARPQQFIIGDDETESELSLESRSFLHRVNDQVWKRQYQSLKDATKDSDKHSVIWWMFMSSNNTTICIHGEELLRQMAFHQRYRRSHNEADVRHIWEISVRTIRRDLWNEYN